LKTRTGFVSNSSSSSFIVGIGRISDKDKFNTWMKENDVKTDYDVSVFKVKDGNSYEGSIRNGKVTIDSFQSSASAKIETDDDEFFVVNYAGNEGDSAFESSEWGDIDYDIDVYHYLTNNVKKAIQAFSDINSGIDTSTADQSMGAGRNG
jgi:hypothetical protein